MRNFQDTFETRKRSFIRVFSIGMIVPSKWKKSSFLMILEGIKVN